MSHKNCPVENFPLQNFICNALSKLSFLVSLTMCSSQNVPDKLLFTVSVKECFVQNCPSVVPRILCTNCPLQCPLKSVLLKLSCNVFYRVSFPECSIRYAQYFLKSVQFIIECVLCNVPYKSSFIVSFTANHLQIVFYSVP